MKSKYEQAYREGFYASNRERMAFIVFWVIYFSTAALCAILLYLLST